MLYVVVWCSCCLFSSSSFQQLNPEYLIVTGAIFHITGTKKTWLREERLNEGHSFGDGSAPWWRGQAEHFILYSRQEIDTAREREKRLAQNTTPSRIFPSVLLPLSRHQHPSFHYLSIMSSCYKSIKGLTHSLSIQSPPWDPILYGNALTDTPRGVFH